MSDNMSLEITYPVKIMRCFGEEGLHFCENPDAFFTK